MTSEEALEILEDRCQEHKTKAHRKLRSNPKESVFHFSKAADIHERLANEAGSGQVAEAHHSQADNMQSNARRLMEKLGRVQSSNDGRGPGRDEGDSKKTGSESRTSHGSADASTDSRYFESAPARALDDVGGMDDLKQRLTDDIKLPLQNPKYFQKQSAGIENGVLLYGPPGTGKSYLAECFAGEIGFRYASINASDVVSKYVGEAAQNINQLFEEAKQNEPCVIFLDEIDAIASDRSDGVEKTNSERQMVNELLQHMQDVQDSQVLVIAATNKPDELDEALTRSQRFNQKFHVGPPSPEARKQILKVQLDEDGREVDYDHINWQKLVDWSEGFSAADLAKVVEDAARQSARESSEQDQLVPVHYRHLLEAMKRTEASLKYYDDGR